MKSFGYRGIFPKSLTLLACLIPAFLSAGALAEFAYIIFKENKVPDRDAKLMSSALEEESQRIPSAVDPLMIIAFAYAESLFRNVYGDHGKAVGYFQLHENAVLYVANFYDDVRQFKRTHRPHAELMKYPDWQLRIAYRYVFLTLKHVFNWDLVRTISAYNGRSSRYNVYIERFFKFYAEIVSRYVHFTKEASKISQSSGGKR